MRVFEQAPFSTGKSCAFYNSHGYQLDLVFSTEPEKLTSIDEYPGKFDTDHSLLTVSLLLSLRPRASWAKTVFNKKKGDYERLRVTL